MNNTIIGRLLLVFSCLMTIVIIPAQAADYEIDAKRAHASIDFRIKHLGIGWVSGRFSEFSGTFSYDSNEPLISTIDVIINVASVDTNFEPRDHHLRSSDFFNTDVFPQAHFVSTSFEQGKNDGEFVIHGEFSLHGVTRPLDIAIEKVGEGADAWGAYRVGFVGTTSIKMADYGMNVTRLGPDSQEAFLTLSIEGTRK